MGRDVDLYIERELNKLEIVRQRSRPPNPSGARDYLWRSCTQSLEISSAPVLSAPLLLTRTHFLLFLMSAISGVYAPFPCPLLGLT